MAISLRQFLSNVAGWELPFLMEGNMRLLMDSSKMMKRLKICLLTLIPILFFWAGAAQADLSIAPSHVEVNLDKGMPSGVFEIANKGDTEARYRIQATDFNIDSRGVMEVGKPNERSMSSWIVFNPKEFTLPPHSTRKVRFAISPKGKLQAGEYWAAMELESLDTVRQTIKDDGGREMVVEVVPCIIVPIYGKYGKLRLRGISKEIKVVSSGKGKTIEAWVANTGEGRFRIKGQYEIVSESGKVVEKGDLGKGLIFPGGNLKFLVAVKTEMETGTYSIKVRYESEELGQPILDEIQFMAKTSSSCPRETAKTS